MAIVDDPRTPGEQNTGPHVLRRRGLRGRVVLWMAGVAALLAILAATHRDRLTEWWVQAHPESDASELQALKLAVSRDSHRVIPGRLSDEFPYAPPPAQARGLAQPAAPSPDLRIAAATIEKHARELNTPAATARLGVAYIALADWDRAIDVLEEAVALDTRAVPFQNDLSVAYLGRAATQLRPEDWVHALAAASRAIRLDRGAAAPHFNRAVALRGLRLTADESAALTDYVRLDRQ